MLSEKVTSGKILRKNLLFTSIYRKVARSILQLGYVRGEKWEWRGAKMDNSFTLYTSILLESFLC